MLDKLYKIIRVFFAYLLILGPLCIVPIVYGIIACANGEWWGIILVAFGVFLLYYILKPEKTYKARNCTDEPAKINQKKTIENNPTEHPQKTNKSFPWKASSIILSVITIIAIVVASGLYNEGYSDGYLAGHINGYDAGVEYGKSSVQNKISALFEQGSSIATPAPQTPFISSKVQNQSETVYVTRTGAKYHRLGCQYLKDSCIAMNLDDAIKEGYTACSKCW